MDLQKSERHGAKLQAALTQEKAQNTALMHTKQSLEGAIRGMQTKIDEVQAEKQALEEKLSGLDTETAKFEAKIEKLYERIKAIKASRDEVIERYKEKVAIIRENEQKIAELSENLQRTDFELKRTHRSLSNCKENNERLCLITEELVEKYKNKGMLGSIMEAEPFTQLRKVEVEKLIQEYTAKIDKERVE